MPKNPRSLGKVVVGAGFAAEVQHLVLTPVFSGTSTRTVALFRAPRRMRVRSATYSQELAVDGAKTMTVRNATKNVDVTTALTVNGLGALGSAAFTLSSTDNNRIIRAGDVVTLLYTVTTAGTVAPSQVGIDMEVQLL